MDPLHSLNLLVHVGAGSAGILVGLAMLIRPKGTPLHIRRGRIFSICVLVVTATAALGSIFFRFMPLFVVLTVLTTYQLVSGWRSVRNKEAGPSLFDAVWTGAAIATTILLLPMLLAAPTHGNSQPIVVLSTLGALALVLAYDFLRWLFPRRWFATLWTYEHIYKLVASFSALLSAFVGNVIQFGQPWSQVVPSAFGVLLIVWYFLRLAQRRQRTVPHVDGSIASP